MLFSLHMDILSTCFLFQCSRVTTKLSPLLQADLLYDYFTIFTLTCAQGAVPVQAEENKLFFLSV